ncbi:MAG: TerB family tellurite resistance protein [Thiohalomonadales bacterium]
MIDAIKKFFNDSILDNAQENTGDDSRLKVASAALLLEMARADFAIEKQELHQVAASVRKFFGLTEQATQELLVLAEQEANDATCHYEFITLINKGFSKQDRIRLVEMLWQVAYVDERLEKHEEAMLRKIADLMYVSHSDFIATKLKVLKERDSKQN